jgi:sugar O-acyltransferase (sialic acid O-acetyltransferase NeuD family)
VKPIVFWGATGQARVLRECVGHQGYSLVALFDNDPQVLSPFPDVPLFYGREGFLHWRAAFDPSPVNGLVAIGGARGPDRVAIQQMLEAHQVAPIITVHPTAFVSAGVRLAPGCQILAHATVVGDAQLGLSCIINTAASVDHEAILGDGVHVAPGATLAGCVTIQEYAFIGAGATVLPNLRIGRRAVVGAGAVVTRDVPENAVVYGNPARVQRYK